MWRPVIDSGLDAAFISARIGNNSAPVVLCQINATNYILRFNNSISDGTEPEAHDTHV
jgi:hypothetical protein